MCIRDRGAGSVDAALNNFVALHYKSMHMNWLHCFWGVGHRGTDDHVLLSGWRRLAQRLWSHCCAAVCPGGGPVAVPEALAGEGRDQPGWGLSLIHISLLIAERWLSNSELDTTNFMIIIF